MKTLIIIDVQYDFLPGGSLAVEDGDKVIPVINEYIPEYDLILATQDWHPSNHQSFASQHDEKTVFEVIDLNGLEQVLWPDHCVQGTNGAEFHKDLNVKPVEAIFRKGMNPEIDSYSGFYDNGHLKSTGLVGYLKNKEVSEVHFAGLAADYCVHYSILDALNEGFKVSLIQNGTRPIDEANYKNQLNQLVENPNFNLI